MLRVTSYLLPIIPPTKYFLGLIEIEIYNLATEEILGHLYPLYYLCEEGGGGVCACTFNDLKRKVSTYIHLIHINLEED